MRKQMLVNVVLTLAVMLMVPGCGTKSKSVEKVKPSEPVVVPPVQTPVQTPVPVQSSVDDGELQRLRDECERVKRELAEAGERVMTLMAENASAESLNVSLAEQVKQAEAKMESMAGRHEARTGSLYSWLTIVSITGIVMFFVGISLGSCTRRAFYAVDREGGRHEPEEE